MYTGPGATDNYGQPTPAKEQHWYDEAVGYWTLAQNYIPHPVERLNKWEEQVADDFNGWYSKTEFSDKVDVALPKAQAALDDAETTAKKIAGYATDPEKLQETLNTLKWVVIGASVLYALWMIAPLVRR